MTDRPVNLSTSGPPETVLDPEPPAVLDALAAALAAPVAERRDAVAAVVADHPRFLDGWARLGQLGRDDIEHCAAGETFARWFMMVTDMTRGEMLAKPVAARPEDWAVLQLLAYRFVVEMPEFRLLLPSSPGEPIIATEFGTLG